MENDKRQRSGSGHPIKDVLGGSLRSRVQQYVSQRETVRAIVERDPLTPGRKRESDRQNVIHGIERLERIFQEIVPYVRNIRSRIAVLTDQTNLAACYFLFGKVSQSVRAIFLLAKEGFHYEVIEIVRSSREALDLIALFLRERPDSPLLKQWFEGKIVQNQKARKALTDMISDSAQKSGTVLPVTEMKSGLYASLSKYAHVSYAALLDSYDVYTDDFDFERGAGFHYVKVSSLPYVEGELHALIIGLKEFYQTVGDLESYGRLDKILREHAPHMYDDAAREERMNDIRRRFPGLA